MRRQRTRKGSFRLPAPSPRMCRSSICIARRAARHCARRLKRCQVIPSGCWADVRDQLLAADAFISPSFNEGRPTSLLAAGSAGVPCITTRVGSALQFGEAPNRVFVNALAESIEAGLREVTAIPLAERLADGTRLADFASKRFSPSVGAARYRVIYEGRDLAPSGAGHW